MSQSVKTLHSLLTKIPLVKNAQRLLVESVKRNLGVPDAFSDISALIRKTKPYAVLDVGCHKGKTIKRILEKDKLPIYGFEPTKATFKELEKSFQNHPLVSLHNVALSNETGIATFHFNNNEQTNSLLANDVGNASLGSVTANVGTESIETIRLDDWVQEFLPNKNLVVKCDIQGAEGLMLSGGIETFPNRVIGIYSEAQIAPMYEGQADFFELNTRLAEFGFYLHNIYPCFHDHNGRALQTDAFWINEKFAASFE